MIPLDDEIREHFADLRIVNDARAPRFSAVWREAERRAAPPARSRRVVSGWWLAAAASVVIAAALVLRHPRPTPGDPVATDPEAYPSIAYWTPPTDAFMQMAQRSASAPPATVGSLLDGVTVHVVSPDSFK